MKLKRTFLLLFSLSFLVFLVQAQVQPRRYQVDLLWERKPIDLSHLVIWDQIDVYVKEYVRPGFMWVVDPAHGEDDFFTVKEIKSFNDRDRDRKTDIVKRIYTIEFLKTGKYDLRLIRVHQKWLDYVMQRGTLAQTFVDKEVIDDIIVLPLVIEESIDRK